jgi:hypothetical protein
MGVVFSFMECGLHICRRKFVERHGDRVSHLPGWIGRQDVQERGQGPGVILTPRDEAIDDLMAASPVRVGESG